MEDLPPGFRFYPTEEELVSFYLHHKLEGSRPDLNLIMDRIIPVLDIYQHNPWQLPQMGGIWNREEEQWLFFVERQESEARGGRPKRVTENGYWKATGSPGNVYSNNRIIGVKRTMVFYTGRAPNGIKTDWKMNEYKSIVHSPPDNPSSSTPAPPMLRHEFNLCRVYKKSKSIRAFDRRPLGVEMRGQSAGAPSDLHQNMASSSSLAQNSPQSSSSDDHGTNYSNNPTQTSNENANHLPMSIDTQTEALWDWDQLELYYGPDRK